MTVKGSLQTCSKNVIYVLKCNIICNTAEKVCHLRFHDLHAPNSVCGRVDSQGDEWFVVRRACPELATVVPDSYSSAAMGVVLSLRAASVAAPMYFPDFEIEKTAASLASEGLDRKKRFWGMRFPTANSCDKIVLSRVGLVLVCALSESPNSQSSFSMKMRTK